MNWLPQLSSGYFAVAGLLCAAGPILIHLLNRRRFRRVEWAAMDFLFEALHQQKRRLQLRDLILLLLRAAAVLFFGLALARPYFRSDESRVAANSPRHLIVLLDNSLSMGYRQLDTTTLELAKQQAGEIIESLPEGSQVTIIGTCGSWDVSHGPIRRKSDALEFLTTVRLVDSASRIEEAIAAARKAIGTAAPLADQIVYFSDLQRNNWPNQLESVSSESASFGQLPTWQIRDMSHGAWDNGWVADIQLRDGIVDLDTPATLFVTVRYQGPAPRRTQVSLAVNSQVVSTRSVELPAGRTERQFAFECSFADALVGTGDATFVPLQVTITRDRLEQDDHRTIMVPVVTSLPVVFVDQYTSADEDPALGRLGETRPLRHLLAPNTVEADQRPLVDVQHVTISELNRSLLASARLVVIAGIADPGTASELLRQYVALGGQLVVAAGGSFDPMAWNLAEGLLPARLKEQAIGVAPDETGDSPLEPFSLSLQSLSSASLLRLPGLADEELHEIYGEPLFFKSVAFESPIPETSNQQQDTPNSTAVPLSKSWLTWNSPARSIQSSPPLSADQRTVRPHTQVCGRFTDAANTPFLIRHRVGRGELLFVSTSILPTWNNLAQTNAVVLWDHVLRSLIRSTLPQHNFSAQEHLSIPVPVRERGVQVRLQRPGAVAVEMLDVGFIQQDQQGVTIPNCWTRGRYRLHATNTLTDTLQPGPSSWKMEVAVNGNADESDLTPLSSEEIQTHIIDSGFGQLFTGSSPAAFQSAVHGNALWWWLALAVFMLLASELGLLALSGRGAVRG